MRIAFVLLTLLSLFLLMNPLCAEEAKAKEEEVAPLGPQPLMGPWWQYDRPNSAVVRWVTQEPVSSVLQWDSAGQSQQVESAPAVTQHEVRVNGLPHQSVGLYRVFLSAQGIPVPSRDYEYDTMFNYARAEAPTPWSKADASDDDHYPSTAAFLLSQSKATGGYCVVMGCGNGRLIYELVKQSPFYVVAVDTDAQAVAQARSSLRKAGVYGHRATIHQLEDWDKLPFTRFFANLVLSNTVLETGKPVAKAATWYRIVRPQGGALFFGQPEKSAHPLDVEALKAWFQSDGVDAQLIDTDQGCWFKATRSGLEGAGQWTHQYGRPDNSARSGENLLGATRTKDLEVQWLGRPGPRAMVDRNPRKPSPLYTNGRLFTQGLNRIIAQDVYNGAILWSLEIPDFHRYNMPRDCSNWCADEDRLYLAVREKCWLLNAATGALEKTYEVLPAAAGKAWEWGYLARENDLLFGSSQVQGAAYSNFRGQALQGWYDSKVGQVTYKVCSDSFFALDAASGETRWTYKQGLIINPTITMADGKVFFIQSRSEAAQEVENRRISSRRLAKEWYLTALDAASGETLWEEVLSDTEKGKVVLYLLHAKDRLLMATSDTDYHLYGFDAATGSRLWDAKHAWTADNHSGHMQHPAVVGEVVYFEPHGYALADGKLVTEKMGRHEGCATYVATEGGLIYRGIGRRIAMWDAQSEKVSTWDRLRPGCWLSTIAGAGMVLSPEGGGGCSCGGWMETSLTFLKKEE